MITPASCKGTVVGRTVLLEEGADLPEGALVEVRLLADPERPTQLSDRQQALQRLLSMDLPVSDWPQMEDEIIRGAIE